MWLGRPPPTPLWASATSCAWAPLPRMFSLWNACFVCSPWKFLLLKKLASFIYRTIPALNAQDLVGFSVPTRWYGHRRRGNPDHCMVFQCPSSGHSLPLVPSPWQALTCLPSPWSRLVRPFRGIITLWSSVSGSFHLGSSKLWHIWYFILFWHPNNIPLYGYTTFCLSIHPLKDI